MLKCSITRFAHEIAPIAIGAKLLNGYLYLREIVGNSAKSRGHGMKSGELRIEEFRISNFELAGSRENRQQVWSLERGER